MSSVLPCLNRSTGQKLGGFKLIEKYLADPTSFGYVHSLIRPHLCDTPCLAHLKFVSLLAGRGSEKNRKGLFVLADEGDNRIVLKVFANKKTAEREFAALQALEGVPNIIALQCDACISVNVEWEIENSETVGETEIVNCTGFLVEYCTVLVPSEARPVHIAKCGLALAEASKRNVFHNDISPDNLMISVQHQEPVVCDFDLATRNSEIVNPNGKFSGKPLFAPCVAFERGRERCGSFVADLESLLYTAYTFAHDGAVWSSSFRNDHLTGRSRTCAFRTRGTVKLPEGQDEVWGLFLAALSDAFGQDGAQESEVKSNLVNILQNWSQDEN
jgi:hypothetical protein